MIKLRVRTLLTADSAIVSHFCIHIKYVSRCYPPPCNQNDSRQKIDAVYLWCDGSDQNFQKAKEERLKELNLPFQEDNVGDLRFADNEELKYSLRSIHQNAPWINHIYIVTNKQKPAWLKEHPKITIVDHCEIIPSELLPTFNSVVIEMHVHKIHGLQEKFLLFNDDMFIKNPVSPDFFFDGDKPIVRLQEVPKQMQYTSIEEAENVINNHLEHSFRETQIRAWLMACKLHGYHKMLVLSHTVDGMTKTAITKTLENYPEILKRNHSPFRTGDEVQRLIFQLEMLYGMGARLELQKKPSFLEKHFKFSSKSILNSFEGTESDKVRSRIRKFNPVMFCLNADIKMDAENRLKSKQFLEECFPNKSPFEQ